MSSHFNTNVQMTCADFEKSFDRYVDGLLDGDAFAACERHVAMCRACDREVARWQQTSILLSTAVADFASAVDVSSLRSSVEAALGFPEATEPRRRAVDREASYGRVTADRPAVRRSAGRTASREAGQGRRASFAATLRFVSAAAVSAATAAAAVLLLTPAPGPQGLSNVVASASSSVSSSSGASSGASLFMPASLRNVGRHIVNEVAPAAYAPPPLAQPQVSHVDGLEAAPGRQVSTWVQPKTNARVIWVEDRGTGAPVRTAGLDR